MRLTEFADAMCRELDQNDHKGGWSDCTFHYLLRRLEEELAELRTATRDGSPHEHVTAEAADVANFAYMIADNYSQGRRGKV